MMRLVKNFFVVTFLLCAGTVFGEVPTDFDADGVSDLTYISTAASGKLAWKSASSTGMGTQINVELGVPSDKVVPAFWIAPGVTVLGVVRIEELNGPLLWRIEQGAFIDTERFGKDGDVVIAGADFDGNGIGDAAVVHHRPVKKKKKNRNKNKAFLWQIRNDLFADDDAEIKRIFFGRKDDRIFFANIDGEGDWLGAFGKGKDGKARLELRDVETEESFNSNKIPGILTRNSRPRPFPLAQADGTDLIAIATQDSSSTSIYIYDKEGNEVSNLTIESLGDLAVGDYLNAEAGEEIAINEIARTPDVVHIVNPITKASVDRTVQDGTLIDQIQVTLIDSGNPSG